MSDWYEKYREDVRKEAEKVKPVKEVDQGTLWLKAIGTEAFKNVEGAGYLNHNDKFYFTEILVNQLMQFAYNQGAKAIDEKSAYAGYHRARKEMAEFLGCEYDD